MKKYNIVIFSNQFFDQALKTNKWHVATRLALLGHNVIFIDPPTRFKTMKNFFVGRLSLQRILSGVKKEKENLIVYTPMNLFNFKPFSAFNCLYHSKKISKLLGNFDKAPVIAWIYHFDFPDLPDFLKTMNYDLMIYDVVDEYTAFPEYSLGVRLNKGIVAMIQKLDDVLKIHLNQKGIFGKDWVIERERWLAETCDLIFATAPTLVLKFKKILTELQKDLGIVYYVPNSGDYTRFKDSKRLSDQVPEDMEGIHRPRIVLAGAIDSFKLNLSLIEKCARYYPNYSFVLIGPKKVSDPNLNLSRFDKLKNVYFLGEKVYEQMPNYFAGTDVFIIPYNLNDYTIGGCYPVKFHDAMSAGLPIVVTNLPVYKEFAQVCYIARNEEDFIELIKKALEEDSLARIKARQDVAKENSWEIKVANQLSLIEKYLVKT